MKKKLLSAAIIVLSLAVIALGILALTDVWEQSMTLAMPLMAALMALQAASNWEKSRDIAWFSLIAGVFVLGCWCVVLFL